MKYEPIFEFYGPNLSQVQRLFFGKYIQEI